MPDFDASAPPVLGVDVGGTKILTGLVGADGAVLCSRRSAMDRSNTESTLSSIRRAVEEFLAAEGAHARFSAVGFGLVGRCDPENGVWVRADNLPIPKPVALAEEMARRLGVPAFLDNDVFCATTAERYFGAGRRHRNFVLINAGTGLSAGAVTDGRLLRGAGNVAGEIGRTTMGLRDWNSGTLEEHCSGGGILARAGKERYADTRAVFAAAEAGDAHARAIVDDAVASLSEAAACLVTLYNPSALVLAGSVALNARVRGTLEEYVRARAYRSSLMDLKEVIASDLSEGTVGLIGAAQAARVRMGAIDG